MVLKRVCPLISGSRGGGGRNKPWGGVLACKQGLKAARNSSGLSRSRGKRGDDRNARGDTTAGTESRTCTVRAAVLASEPATDAGGVEGVCAAEDDTETGAWFGFFETD